MAQAAGLKGQVTIAASFGCPFEGEVAEDRVVAMAATLAEASPAEVALADTIGVADPAHVARLVRRVAAAIAPLPVRVHFHNTRGTGLANVWAAIEAGASVVDAALGGLGGCPFAPGAAGNVASEDVIYMLERAGIRTGMDLAKMVEANAWLTTLMGRKLPSMVAQAPAFPGICAEGWTGPACFLGGVTNSVVARVARAAFGLAIWTPRPHQQCVLPQEQRPRSNHGGAIAFMSELDGPERLQKTVDKYIVF
jgi:hydroxymethylglutaryl-CoA lyase